MTTDVSTPVEPGTNDEATTGAETQTASTEEKKFTQVELDTFLKNRLAEQSKSLRSKFEKDMEEKTNTAREEALKDLDKLVDERVTAREAEKALNAARTTIAAEYGLSEDAASRLVGDTPDALHKDAEKIFGAFKQQNPKPPTLNTGAAASAAGNAGGEPSAAEIRERFRKDPSNTLQKARFS